MARKRARTTGYFRKLSPGKQTVNLKRWNKEAQPYVPLTEERPAGQGKDPMASALYPDYNAGGRHAKKSSNGADSVGDKDSD